MHSNGLQRQRRVLHVYGDTHLQSSFCQNCNRSAFVVSGKFSCCGAAAQADEWEEFQIEVDTSNKKRKTPSARQREEILEQQANCCFYCDAQFGTWRKIGGRYLEVCIHWDHAVPFSYDGNNREFVAACVECNLHKHARHFFDVQEARIYLQTKLYEKQGYSRKELPELRQEVQPKTKLAEVLQPPLPMGPLARVASKSKPLRTRYDSQRTNRALLMLLFMALHPQTSRLH